MHPLSDANIIGHGRTVPLTIPAVWGPAGWCFRRAMEMIRRDDSGLQRVHHEHIFNVTVLIFGIAV
jgi:hypothetical protein